MVALPYLLISSLYVLLGWIELVNVKTGCCEGGKDRSSVEGGIAILLAHTAIFLIGILFVVVIAFVFTAVDVAYAALLIQVILLKSWVLALS